MNVSMKDLLKNGNYDNEFNKLKDVIIQEVPSSSVLSNKKWSEIKKKYKDRLRLISDSPKHPDYQSDCFLDYIICGREEKRRGREDSNCKTVEAYNNLIAYIQMDSIYGRYKHKIDEKIQKIFTIDIDPNQKQTSFKNTLNELNFLKFLLDCSIVEDISIEEKCLGSKYCDYVIRLKNSEKRIGLEIETVQFFNAEKSKSTEGIEKFLENRAEVKWNKKLANLKEIPELDEFKIVLFVEDNPTMGKVAFPEQFNENMIVVSTECYYYKGWKLRVVDTLNHIKRLKKDENHFFI